MGGKAPRVILVPKSVAKSVKDALERSKDDASGPSPDAPAPSKPESVPGAEEPKPETDPSDVNATKEEPVVTDVASSPTDILRNLLDTTHVPPGTEPSHFHSIAQTLIQDFELCVTSKTSVVTTYQFLEVEFYWYFHRAPRRVPPNSQSTAPVPSPKTSGFRAGTRKGLDLTFGVPAASSDSTVAYGGILLRTLRNTETKKVTCGPSLLVDEVIRSAGVESLPALVDTVWKGDTSAFLLPTDSTEPGPSRVFLCPTKGKSAKPAKMYTSPRIGLELSRIQTPGEATATHPRVQYVIRPYRFFTHPELMGPIRPQTFYGLLQAHEAGQLSRSGIAEVSGMKPTQVPTFFGVKALGRWRPSF
ncbi:hypothetical protein RSOLAG22IIIB_03030 [Rhizoctonia solani]|uniref:Uncharacterized protein n=1 Tax=Rhizoctonia solani TaxID=456999 RepID=A0A0K6FN45_9AGAM|nr:hypothetical protein RSOLAG22IIIB_03030 [Rhizoctonia solani]